VSVARLRELLSLRLGLLTVRHERLGLGLGLGLATRTTSEVMCVYFFLLFFWVVSSSFSLSLLQDRTEGFAALTLLNC
jgi:hypothetical protein